MSTVVVSSPIKKGLSFSTFSLILLYFFGLINIEYAALGFSESLFPVTEEVHLIFDIIFWVIIVLLTCELIIAYLEVRNSRMFLRKYWLEIILLVLMPLFVGLKAIKFSLKLVKQIKISKTAFKAFQKFKKSKK